MTYVKVQQEKGYLRVTLNRQLQKNALHSEMIADLVKVFSEPLAAENRFVLLGGEGDSFCAGADIQWMKSSSKFDIAKNIVEAEKIFSLYLSVFTCEIPIVAFARGHALGGGLGLLACADIVIAHTDTVFSLSEVRLGIAPSVVYCFLADRFNNSLMTEVMLTGRNFSAQEAYHMGLVHHVTDDQTAEAIFAKVKSQLLQAAPQATRATKKMLRSRQIDSILKQKENAVKLIAQLRAGNEGLEGLSAFLENRTPHW